MSTGDERGFDSTPIDTPADRDRPTKRRSRIGLRVTVGLLVLVVIGAAVASRWSVPYYSITPGTALDVGSLISVPKNVSHQHAGQFILTDVELAPLSALTYAYYELKNRSEIVSSNDLTGGESSAEYDEQGVIDMVTARQAATLVALRTLGYKSTAAASGVVVYATAPGTPVDATPAVGEVITAVAGRPSLAVGTLRAAVSAERPGSSIALTFRSIRSGASTTKEYEVGVRYLKGSGKSAVYTCAPPGTSNKGALVRQKGQTLSCLPFYPEQLYRNVDVPFAISLQNDGIIGPSAGLSYTLGLIEKLDQEDLTGGHRVAATGTMANDGTVGAVGGVAQKTIAVRAAGATVFLVPPSGLAAARANAGSGLRVIAVSSIEQAVAALEHLGGKLVSAATRR